LSWQVGFDKLKYGFRIVPALLLSTAVQKCFLLPGDATIVAIGKSGQTHQPAGELTLFVRPVAGFTIAPQNLCF
jgi:hypothetical protein